VIAGGSISERVEFFDHATTKEHVSTVVTDLHRQNIKQAIIAFNVVTPALALGWLI